jgi:hypothetical protein
VAEEVGREIIIEAEEDKPKCRREMAGRYVRFYEGMGALEGEKSKLKTCRIP